VLQLHWSQKLTPFGETLQDLDDYRNGVRLSAAPSLGSGQEMGSK